VVKRSALDAYFQIWLTCGTRDLYVMLLSICKFLEYWDREGHTFIMALCGITFIWVPWSIWHFESKKCFGNGCVLCHWEQ